MMNSVGHQISLSTISRQWVAAWPSCKVVGRINEVTLHRARLILRWVTLCMYTNIPSRYVTSHPGQLSLSSIRGR